HGEIAGAGFEHALDQFDWLADRTEPGEQQRRTVLDAGDGGANVFDLLVDHAARPHAAWGFRTRSADAGYFTSIVAGRSGRATRLPPQFGHTPPSRCSAQSRQNVHSNVQITASAASGGRSLSQHSQLGRNASMVAPSIFAHHNPRRP